VLPETWAPRDIVVDSTDPLPVPYLADPPEAVDVSVGRQLFVDDFLIAETDLERQWHAAEPHPENPVLVPETEVEMDDGYCPSAAPFNDGVWFDPDDGLFKLWYQAGWFHGTGLATSMDGIHWERPELDVVPGTNLVYLPPKGVYRDGCLVWRDPRDSQERRWKMFQFFRDCREERSEFGMLYASPDGIHWQELGKTSPCGDNSSLFYNPFRKKWVMSIRKGPTIGGSWKRARFYYEHEDFEEACRWAPVDDSFWLRVDEDDEPDPMVGMQPELYDVNAAPYESLMLGLFNVFYGPQNPDCAKAGTPKIIDMQAAFSRDGFHFSRPSREALVPCSRQMGTWDYGYIHAAGGGCLVVGDQLYIYYGAFSGQSPRLGPGENGPYPNANAMYAGASTGLATLRRDGFASMRAGNRGGALTTRCLESSDRLLFVNSNCADLRVAVLGPDGSVLSGYGEDDCLPVSGDSPRGRIRWRNHESLPDGRFGLRFRVMDGGLYSFWTSPDERGTSGGYVAAGGPGFAADQDV
jgi:hypothetical protein